ncbi:MAG: glycosyltransferase family 2 protein [Thermoanaerobaculia bacterium]|jgi:glycosyltransferase involved in cell wall biosynthesis
MTVSSVTRGRKLPITAFIAVKNESANLPRCLSAAAMVERVIVVDSHSTDSTLEIARSAGAEVVQFEYGGGYPKKRQWALESVGVTTPWVMLLDADEVVPPPLWAEIERAISPGTAPDAFLVMKAFHFLGRKFRWGGFSHSAVALFRTGKARFERLFDDGPDGLDMEVHERVLVDGAVGRLMTPLIHQDFKGLEAYIERHNKYSTWEARLRHRYLTSGKYGEETIASRLLGNSQERRRFLKAVIVRLPVESQLWFVYHFVLRLGFLEGRRGLIACQIRASYIAQVRAKVFELQLLGTLQR